MFARALLNDEVWYMTIGWFGLGNLRVSHYPTGRNASAPKWLKDYFLKTVNYLSTEGMEINQSNLVFVEFLEVFAEIILSPNSLRARATLLKTPQQLAESILSLKNTVKAESSGCRCFNPPFNHQDFDFNHIGIDITNQRNGEVTVQTCKSCGKKWLNYHVEHEAFTASGRWFRGQIDNNELSRISAENALQFLEQLPWHFVGGSYYRSSGILSTRKINVDF